MRGSEGKGMAIHCRGHGIVWWAVRVPTQTVGSHWFKECIEG